MAEPLGRVVEEAAGDDTRSSPYAYPLVDITKTPLTVIITAVCVASVCNMACAQPAVHNDCAKSFASQLRATVPSCPRTIDTTVSPALFMFVTFTISVSSPVPASINVNLKYWLP